MTDPATPVRRTRQTALRIAIALGMALSVALGVYFLIQLTRPDNGLVSFTFLLMLPAALSAFVAYVGDPWAERSRGYDFAVPAVLVAACIAAAIVFLREGAVCIIILSPLWYGLGLAGALLLRSARRPRTRHPDVFSSGLLLLPVIALVVEPAIPLASATAVVTREVVVQAPPEMIWPLLRGIPDVQPDEGAGT